jgi:hypothetical protein
VGFAFERPRPDRRCGRCDPGVVEGLEVDAERMRANIPADALAEAARFGIDAQSPEQYLGAAETFVERALERFEAERGGP